MRSELITIYRYSSPRTGRKYDSKLIDKRQLSFYLKRGYFQTLPQEKEKEEDPDTEAEPKKEKKIKKLKIEDLSAEEKESIRLDKRSMMKLADVHNTSYHVIRKIKGKS